MTTPDPHPEEDQANPVRRAAPMLLAIPLIGVATGGLFPLVALDLDRLGFDERFIGLVTSLYYAGALCGALTFGVVVRAIGVRAGFALAMAALSICGLALAHAADPLTWLALRALGGYALGAGYVVADAWIAGAASKRNRGTLFGLYETLRLGAVALGPSLILIGGVVDAYGVVALAYAVAAIPIICSQPPQIIEKKTLAAALSELGDLIRCYPGPFAIALCGGACNASFYGLGALFANDVGMSPQQIALFVGAILLAPALFEIAIGAAADRYARMPTVLVIATAAIAAAAWLGFATPATIWGVLALGLIVGAGAVPLYALALTRIVDTAGEHRAIAAASLCAVIYNLGGALGPAASGAVMDWRGPSGLYLAVALFICVAAASAAFDILRNRCCAEPRTA